MISGPLRPDSGWVVVTLCGLVTQGRAIIWFTMPP